MSDQVLGGFAVVASVSRQPELGEDVTVIITSFYTPTPKTQPLQPLSIFYAMEGAIKANITAPGYESGVIDGMTGAVEILEGLLVTTVFTLHVLDADENPVILNGNPLTATLKVIVT